MHKSIIGLALFAIVAAAGAYDSNEYGIDYDNFGNTDTILVQVPQTVVQLAPRPVYLRRRVNPEIAASLGGVIQTPLADLGAGVRAGISPSGARFEASIGLGAPGGWGRGRIVG